MVSLKERKFSAKAFYSFLTLGGAEAFPMRVVWNLWVPTIFGFSAWEASWGTLDRLKKMGGFFSK